MENQNTTPVKKKNPSKLLNAFKRFRFKKPQLSSIDRKQFKRALCVVLAAALLVCSIVFGIQKTRAEHRYTNARNVVADQLYSSLYMFCQTFDQVNVPNLDVQNYILPALQGYFNRAVAQNDVMTNAFGARYGVLTNGLASGIQNTFNAFQEAYAAGTSTDQATSDMQQYVDNLRALLEKRYKSGMLQPSR